MDKKKKAKFDKQNPYKNSFWPIFLYFLKSLVRFKFKIVIILKMSKVSKNL